MQVLNLQLFLVAIQNYSPSTDVCHRLSYLKISILLTKSHKNPQIHTLFGYISLLGWLH